MLTMPLVSVIIPVYNSKKYIGKCLYSVINSTYTNLEILVINDGSTDGSDIIINEFTSIDKRIIVFNKDNGGVSSARNIGLDYANGDWICFIDSDDFINSDGIEYLINLTQLYKNVQLIRSYHKQAYLLDTISEKSETIYSRDEFLCSGKIGGYISSLFVQNRIIKENNLKFSTELKLEEDLFFTFQCVLNSDWILVNNYSYYNYLKHTLSATNTISFEKLKNHLVAAEMVYDYSRQYKNKSVDESVKTYLNNGLKGFLRGITTLGSKDVERVKSKTVRKILNEYLRKTDLKLYQVTLKNFFLLITAFINYRILIFFSKIKTTHI